MESKFTLAITDKTLDKEYCKFRMAEIIKMSLSVLILRIIFTIVMTIQIVSLQLKFGDPSVIHEFVSVSFHIFLILISKKYPTVLCNLHGPLFTLSFLLKLINFYTYPMSYVEN